jgi:hypothetical protein
VDGPPSSSLPPSRLVPERHALVHEAHLKLEQCETAKLLEAAALEGVADDGDAREVDIRELAEAHEGEEHVWYKSARRLWSSRKGTRVGGRKPVVRARRRYDSPSNVAMCGQV